MYLLYLLHWLVFAVSSYTSDSNNSDSFYNNNNQLYFPARGLLGLLIAAGPQVCRSWTHWPIGIGRFRSRWDKNDWKVKRCRNPGGKKSISYLVEICFKAFLYQSWEVVTRLKASTNSGETPCKTISTKNQIPFRLFSVLWYGHISLTN